MKKFIFTIVLAFVVASWSYAQSNTTNLNVGLITVDSVASLNPPQNTSWKLWVHIHDLTDFGYYGINYGPGANVNLNTSLLTLLSPVADTVVVVTISGLDPSTTYGYKGVILPGNAQGESVVYSLTTGTITGIQEMQISKTWMIMLYDITGNAITESVFTGDIGMFNPAMKFKSEIKMGGIYIWQGICGGEKRAGKFYYAAK